MNTFLNPVKNIAEKIFGKGPVVDEKTRTTRLSKCLTCNQLICSTMNCKQCLCFALTNAQKKRTRRWHKSSNFYKLFSTNITFIFCFFAIYSK